VVELSGGDARYRDDIGEASPAVAAAMAAYADGTGTEHAVLAALAGDRLLVPVVAIPADDVPVAAQPAAGGDQAGPDGSVPLVAGEKRSEMATPALVGRDGRRALVAFTCADAVRRWQPAARPVPVPAVAVFQAATAESCAVIVDVAGPVPLAVEGARLAALAGGGPPPRMHEDPDVWQLVATAAGRVAPGIRVRLSEPAPGAEFTLEVAPPPGVPGLVPHDVVTRVAQAVREQLADRVRSAVAVIRHPG
jgi:type III secretion system (T3SS) SseB-like protein